MRLALFRSPDYIARPGAQGKGGSGETIKRI